MARILILWNQLDDDVYEHWRRDGQRIADWDPTRVIEPVATLADEMDELTDAVQDAGHTATTVNIRDSIDVLRDALDRERPDAVLNLVEFFGDDFEHEHHIAALFELLGVAYTGNRPSTLSLCQKKPLAKALMVAAGVDTPRSFVVGVSGSVPEAVDLRYPLIVKPALEDASGGIDAGSVVTDRAALVARVEWVVREFKMPALVEEYIAGREIHCALIGGDVPEALPLFEMEFSPGPGPKLITYRAKWDPYSRDFYAMESRCPAVGLRAEQVARIQDMAVRAYQALGCRDYARVDLRLDEVTGVPYVLEVNPNPDLADGSAFIQCVLASGRSYSRVLGELCGFALARRDRLAAAKVAPRDSRDDLLREYLATKGAGAP